MPESYGQGRRLYAKPRSYDARISAHPAVPPIRRCVQALGMTLLKRRSLLPRKTAQATWMGYAKEEDSTVIELYYEYARERVERGDGYGQVAVSTPDVYLAAAAVEETIYNVSTTVQICYIWPMYVPPSNN